MKKFRLCTLPVLIALALLCSACSGVPTEAVKRAEQAKSEAVAEHADTFAPDYWATAEKAMQDATAQINDKKYGEASKFLLRAKTSYDRAHELAKSKREALIKKVTELQTTINIRMKSDLKDNPAAARLAPARKKEFDTEVKGIEDSVLQITEMLKNSQYTEADFLVQKTLRRIYDTQQEFLKK